MWLVELTSGIPQVSISTPPDSPRPWDRQFDGILPGDRVVLRYLSKQELNGQHATVIQQVVGSSPLRWQIKLTSTAKLLSVKEANALVGLPTSSAWSRWRLKWR